MSKDNKNKLKETNLMIDFIAKTSELGINVDYTVILADIAKSLAMIVDKLYESQESEE